MLDRFDSFNSPHSQPSPADFTRIVEGAQTRDPDDFVLLKSYFEGILFAYLKKNLRDEDLAWDILDETILKAWKALPTTDEQLRVWGRMKSWWFTIATNSAKDYWRFQSKLRTISLEYIEEQYQEGDPLQANEYFRSFGVEETEQTVQDREYLSNARKALQQVPEQQRRCFYMKDIEGYSHEEIAQIMCIALSCSRANATRGRKQFLRNLAHLENQRESAREEGRFDE